MVGMYQHFNRYIGMAVASALVTFFFIKPLDHDGMEREDRLVCKAVSLVMELYSYLFGSSASIWKQTDTIPHRWVLMRRLL